MNKVDYDSIIQGADYRITVKEVARMYGVSVPTIWRWLKVDPHFPKAHKIVGTTRWMLSEVQDHIDSFQVKNV